MLQRPAGAQHLKITPLKSSRSILIGRIERVYEAIAKGIGVHIERRMNEVRDIGPKIAIGVIKTNRWTKTVGLDLKPEFAEFVSGQLAVAPFIVYRTLEFTERDLAHNGIQHVLNLRREHHAPAFFVGALNECPKGQLLAKNRSRLGQGKRRVGHQRALLGSQHLMHAVAKLVGKRHDVARLALIVE